VYTNVYLARDSLAGEPNHRRAAVETDNFSPAGDQCFRVQARAASRIEHAPTSDTSKEPETAGRS
jgi:hypothetical protein